MDAYGQGVVIIIIIIITIIIIIPRSPLSVSNAIRQIIKSFANLKSSKKYTRIIADYLILIPS
jgi:hypothetical protein